MKKITLDERFDVEIRLNEKFDSIYSLCYALIDLQAVANSTAYITSKKELKNEKVPTTVRSFGKKYKDELKLKKFSEGSFIATVAAGVATGIILKFLDKYFDSSQTRHIHNHVHIHNDEQRPPIEVKFNNPQVEQHINEVLDSVEIDRENVEVSLERAIGAINESGILGQQHIVYASNGLTVLAHDIERLGRNINISI
ncbi:hypothetical protein GCM10011369_05980 [Neiella marina]|uniref:Uncharacterized protein n=1 Tax=Neiella marina TaxID=508461 RepID=A0A8J2U2K9_9GAMM|nr:hypothetical protein [Neiella marina]GGA67147.1 hypothetical protein GCM10011369_05980 [Neiella marina]